MAKVKNLEVVGVKKDTDDLRFEELWMKRIEILESQYDQHVTKIQKKLLDGRFNKRIVTSFRNQNERLKGRFQDLTRYSEGLEEKLHLVEKDLLKKGAHEDKLKVKLDVSLDETKQQKLRLKVAEKIAKEAVRGRELQQKQIEKDKNQVGKLNRLLRDRENELAQARHDTAKDGERRQSLIGALEKAEEEKQKVCKNVAEMETTNAFLFREHRTDEETMFVMKQELEDLLKQLHEEKQKYKEKERQELLNEKNLESMRDELKGLLSKVMSTSFESRYWKQEAELLLKVAEKSTFPAAKKGETAVQRRGRVRSREAELMHRIVVLERRLNEMEEGKAQVMRKIEMLTTLHNSLIRIHEKNLTQRRSFEENFGLKRLCRRNDVKRIEFSGSRKEIQGQSKKLEALEQELCQSKRAYNFLKFKLQTRQDLEQKLRTAEKTLFEVEREKRETEAVARCAARKLGKVSITKWDSLKEGLLLQVAEVQNLRKKLPPLVPRETMEFGSRLTPKVTPEDLDGKLSVLRRELTILERKQAVFQNIQAAKERLAEEQMRAEDEKMKDTLSDEVFEDTTETEENSLTISAVVDSDAEGDIKDAQFY